MFASTRTAVPMVTGAEAQSRTTEASGSDRRLLRLVAVFKLLKAALLIVTGIGILKLVHSDQADTLQHWVARMRLDPGSHYVNMAIQKMTDLSPRRIRELGIVSFVYAGLFLTEGIGLWLLKRWAEWFTIIATGSLLPIEMYELYRRPTVVKALVLLLNVAVVVYLIFRVKRAK